MLNSAHKNGQCGLDVNKVVKLIAKIDRIDNPKLSYTVGFDAKMAEIFSHFPQEIMNKLIRLGLKYKINSYS